MKLIPLTKGKFAKIDDEDFELISKYKWCVTTTNDDVYYAVTVVITNGVRETVLMHRLIMGCVKGDGKIIDHKNRNGLDNQKINMRLCTHAENQKNKKATGISMYLGVGTARRYWNARICVNGKIIYLGTFRNELDAACEYNEAAIKYHGEFARLNVIPKDHIRTPYIDNRYLKKRQPVKVIDTELNIIYNSIEEAAEKNGIPINRLLRCLKKGANNNTSFKLY